MNFLYLIFGFFISNFGVNCGYSWLLPYSKDTSRESELRSTELENANNEDECYCVIYYLCRDNSVVTDGTGVIDIRRKPLCQKPLDVCCRKPPEETEETQPGNAPQPPRPPPTQQKTRKCGVRNPNGVGSRKTDIRDGLAQFGEFPWAVIVAEKKETPLGTNIVYMCGGSLIHPSVVMTSGHCVTDRRKKFHIRAGEWNAESDDEIYQYRDVSVEEVVVHQNFTSGGLFNDIALLFLKYELPLGNNIGTVCLPKHTTSFDGDKCIANGWGKNGFERGSIHNPIMKKIELPIVPREQCQRALRRTKLGQWFKLHESFVCAGGEENVDTCFGDGGSPLVCPIPDTENRFTQVGIVAWGIDCGVKGIPGVYANVPFLRNWIDEQMFYHNLGTEYYEYD